LSENENIKVYEDLQPGDVENFFYLNGKKNIVCLGKRLNNTTKRIMLTGKLGHYFTSCDNSFYLSKSTFKTFSQNEYVARK